MKQYRLELLANEPLAPGQVLHTYEGADIARAARPGQFVNIRPAAGTDPLLRRPFSICSVDPERGTFTVLIKVVGAGTRLLAELRPGAHVDLLAPLGTSFVWGGEPRVLMVAGGVGVAPLLFLAQSLRDGAGASRASDPPHITFCYGARTAADFVLLERIEPVVDRLVLTTDDGSRGERGRVTVAAERALTPGTAVFACGPNPMMDDLLRRMRARGLEGQVSLENQMGCGIGACQGCVVPTRRGYRRICCEGPVMPTEWFDSIRF